MPASLVESEQTIRAAFAKAARKNGKSTISSGVGLQLLVTEGEAGAEIYTAATKKDQTKIVFDDTKNIAAKNLAIKIIRAPKLHLRSQYHVQDAADVGGC